MKGGPERIGTLPKVTGLINGRAREQIQDLQILSLMFFSLVPSPDTSQLRESCAGLALVEAGPTEVQP